MSPEWVPARQSLSPTWLTSGVAVLFALTVALSAGSAQALQATEQDSPVARSEAIRQVLLTPAQARQAGRFRLPLTADLMAGEQGRSCYGGTPTLTCDAWFITDSTSAPYPKGVAITLAASPAGAKEAFVRLGEQVKQSPGEQVLVSTPNVLITQQTGLAEGPALVPAVSMTVHRIQDSAIVMATCQVEQRRLRMSQLRACAQRLERAQRLRAVGLAQG